MHSLSTENPKHMLLAEWLSGYQAPWGGLDMMAAPVLPPMLRTTKGRSSKRLSRHSLTAPSRVKPVVGYTQDAAHGCVPYMRNSGASHLLTQTKSKQFDRDRVESREPSVSRIAGLTSCP
jgi:hypothetical protein